MKCVKRDVLRMTCMQNLKLPATVDIHPLFSTFVFCVIIQMFHFLLGKHIFIILSAHITTLLEYRLRTALLGHTFVLKVKTCCLQCCRRCYGLVVEKIFCLVTAEKTQVTWFSCIKRPSHNELAFTIAGPKLRVWQTLLLYISNNRWRR